MNLLKMRKQAARNYPDQVTQTFNLMDDTYPFRVDQWIARHGQRMKKKHGKNLKGIRSYRFPMYINTEMKIVLEAELYRRK